MHDITIMAAIILAAIVLFIWNRIPVILVAMGVGMALYATGLVTLNQALSGFGDPAVMFIATLFVVSAALDRTGVTAWAGQMLIRGAGENSRTRLFVLISLLAAMLTALISLNGLRRFCRWRLSWRSGCVCRLRNCSCRWFLPRMRVQNWP
jgi:di/tricarboxylate transporter